MKCVWQFIENNKKKKIKQSLLASGSSHELVSDPSHSQDSKPDLGVTPMITKFEQASFIIIYANIHYNRPHNCYLNKQGLSLFASHNYQKMGSVHESIINSNKSISRRSHHTKTDPQQPNN